MTASYCTNVIKHGVWLVVVVGMGWWGVLAGVIKLD